MQAPYSFGGLEVVSEVMTVVALVRVSRPSRRSTLGPVKEDGRRSRAMW